MLKLRHAVLLLVSIVLAACGHEDPGCPPVGMACTAEQSQYNERCWHKFTIKKVEDREKGLFSAIVPQSVFKESEKKLSEDEIRKLAERRSGPYSIRVRSGTTRDKNLQPVDGPPKVDSTYLMARTCPSDEMELLKEVDEPQK